MIVAAVELKGKDTDASEIAEKLRNGTLAVSDVLVKIGEDGVQPEFYPMVLSKGWRSTHEVVAIKKVKVIAWGQSYDIIRGRCGESLLEIIRRH
ncbi:MAG: hypothetical protein ACREKR_04780 [Candidatus Methylomirabilales bacterium]